MRLGVIRISNGKFNLDRGFNVWTGGESIIQNGGKLRGLGTLIRLWEEKMAAGDIRFNMGEKLYMHYSTALLMPSCMQSVEFQMVVLYCPLGSLLLILPFFIWCFSFLVVCIIPFQWWWVVSTSQWWPRWQWAVIIKVVLWVGVLGVVVVVLLGVRLFFPHPCPLAKGFPGLVLGFPLAILLPVPALLLALVLSGFPCFPGSPLVLLLTSEFLEFPVVPASALFGRHLPACLFLFCLASCIHASRNGA